MSDYGYPRFAWIARVAEDQDLSPMQRMILMYIANQNVKGANDWFCVRQQTVADNLHVRRQTVGGALRRARERGLLGLAVVRPRGTGWHQADTCRLTTPELGAPGRTSFDQSDVRGDGHDSGESDVRGDGELGTPPPQSDVRGDGELCTFDARQNSVSPAETQTLQGEGTGFSDYQGENTQGVESDEATSIRNLFSVFGSGLRVVPEQPALPSPPRYIRSTQPLTDDERCPRHKTPNPRCPICRAYAHGRGQQL
jgi:hypothetical protein